MRTPHAHPDPSTWRDIPVDARVVVRRRLDATEAATSGRRWTDVIGVVVAIDDGGVRLRRDPARRSDPGAGTEVRVAADDVVAVRRLPPRPTPRRDPRRDPDAG
ncbi:DUF6725 family protein [Isoptericola jiangsuensis]|uniref:DUF6725 family protein n=1 Tax=Isoptericola jiangsuensis TaxID=548579 RepID=UPI003AAE8133